MKTKEHEVTVTYKPVKGPAEELMQPRIAWHVKVDGRLLGVATTIHRAQDLLEEHGYKVGAFRRRPRHDGRPRFVAIAKKGKK